MSANIRSLAVSWGLSLTLGAFLPGVCAAEGAGEVSLTAPWEGSVASPPPAPEVTATRVVGPVCKDGPCSEWMGDFIASFEDLNGKWGDPDVLCLGAEDGWKSGCAGAGDRKLPVRYVTVREGAGNEEALVRKIKIADCSEETTTHECTESLYDLKDTGPASGGCKAGVWDEVLKACVQVSGARIVVSGKDGVEARNGDGGGVTQRLLKSRLRAHAKAQKTIGGEGAGGRQFFVVPEAVEGMLCLQFIPPYGGDVQDELLGCGVILAGEEKDGRVVSRGGVGDSVELGKVNGTDYKLVASSVNVMKGVVSWKVEKGQGPYDNKPTLKLVKRRAAPGRGGGVSPEDLAELLAQQQGGSAGSGAAGENPEASQSGEGSAVDVVLNRADMDFVTRLQAGLSKEGQTQVTTMGKGPDGKAKWVKIDVAPTDKDQIANESAVVIRGEYSLVLPGAVACRDEAQHESPNGCFEEEGDKFKIRLVQIQERDVLVDWIPLNKVNTDNKYRLRNGKVVTIESQSVFVVSKDALLSKKLHTETNLAEVSDFEYAEELGAVDKNSDEGKYTLYLQWPGWQEADKDDKESGKQWPSEEWESRWRGRMRALCDQFIRNGSPIFNSPARCAQAESYIHQELAGVGYDSRHHVNKKSKRGDWVPSVSFLTFQKATDSPTHYGTPVVSFNDNVVCHANRGLYWEKSGLGPPNLVFFDSMRQKPPVNRCLQPQEPSAGLDMPPPARGPESEAYLDIGNTTKLIPSRRLADPAS